MRTPHNERLTSGSARPSLPTSAEASESERRCILTGEHAARDALLRLAIAPDGMVLPDIAGKAPGRGAWIGVSRAALEAAMADGSLRKGLMRAFKGAALTIPDDLADRIEAALARQLGDRLGLELRSGNIVLGSARIEEQARAGRLAALLHASDSSEDGRRKLDQAWRVGREAEGSGERGQVLPLDRTALSVALGRDNVVHLGVASRSGDTRAAQRVLQAVSRLAHFVAGDGTDDTNDKGRAQSGNAGAPQASAAHDEYAKD